MSKKNSKFQIARALTSVMQVGLSVVVPIILFILLAKYLINKFMLPDYIMLIAIILGVISGVYNMFKYLILIINNKDG